MHGREHYRRNSYLVIYFFYKCVIFAMPLFWFGIYSSFSATLIYNDILYTVYSFFFTGAPIIWYCVFDRQLPKKQLLGDPATYAIGLNDRCFNYFTFWAQYFNGFW